MTAPPPVTFTADRRRLLVTTERKPIAKKIDVSAAVWRWQRSSAAPS